MNTRRRLLHFLGLGSLFAAATAAKATTPTEPKHPGFLYDEMHDGSMGPPLRRHYKIVDASYRQMRSKEQILWDMERDGWELIAVAGTFNTELIFSRFDFAEPPRPEDRPIKSGAFAQHIESRTFRADELETLSVVKFPAVKP